MVKLKPFFYYLGSKRGLAKYYPPPKYDDIIEPFAGSAGYSLEYYDRNIVLIDRDSLICELWTYLIGASGDDIMKLPIDVTSAEELASLTNEESLLIRFWFGKMNTGPRNRMTSAAQSRPNSVWGAAIRDRIAAQVEHIKHWTVYNSDYSGALFYDRTWFIDPPYTIKGGAYRHHNIDYKELGDFCLSLPGQVIVCEGEQANWLPFVDLRTIQSKGKKCIEKVWING